MDKNPAAAAAPAASCGSVPGALVEPLKLRLLGRPPTSAVASWSPSGASGAGVGTAAAGVTADASAALAPASPRLRAHSDISPAGTSPLRPALFPTASIRTPTQMRIHSACTGCPALARSEPVSTGKTGNIDRAKAPPGGGGGKTHPRVHLGAPNHGHVPVVPVSPAAGSDSPMSSASMKISETAMSKPPWRMSRAYNSA